MVGRCALRSKHSKLWSKITPECPLSKQKAFCMHSSPNYGGTFPGSLVYIWRLCAAVSP